MSFSNRLRAADLSPEPASFHGKKLKQVIDPTLAKAFTHPLRGHIWVTLFERGVVSPAEIADEL